MKGRRPKGVELRVLHGEAKAKAYAERPKPRRAAPRVPDHFDEAERVVWRRVAPELFDAGLYTALDRDALVLLCEHLAAYRRAKDKVAVQGESVLTKAKFNEDGVQIGGGNVIQNPNVSLAAKHEERAVKIMCEFGMTPASRSRVKAEISSARQARADEARAPRMGRVTDEEVLEDPRAVLGM